MNNQTSIKYISSLLDSPNTVTDEDQSSIGLFRQTFPYFVPVRYLIALDSHKKSPYNPQVLSAMQPYSGDWILFCDFLEAGTKPGSEQPSTINKVPDNKIVDIPRPLPEEEVTVVSVPIAEEQVPTFEEAIPVTEEPAIPESATGKKEQDPLISPVYTKDYLLQQGEKISREIPPEINEWKDADAVSEEDKSLMVVMSFSEWLLHFKNSAEQQIEETKDQKALKTMWQKEKLAAAMEEENEEIPESVFNMAVNSISKEENLVSETLADLYIKQGKYDKAIEMYRKLSLQNPQKNAYFARKIEEALKDKQS